MNKFFKLKIIRYYISISPSEFFSLHNMVFILHSDKNIIKKKISLAYYKNGNKNFYHFSRQGENILFQIKKISISLPGYPSLKNKKLFSEVVKSDDYDHDYFFSDVLYLKEDFFFEKTAFLKLKSFKKKNIINPYFIYTFGNYMKANYFLFKESFRKKYDEHNLYCETEINLRHNIKNKTEYILEINHKKTFKNFLTICILVYIKLNINSVSKLYWDSFFTIIVARIFIFILKKSKDLVLNKKSFSKNVKKTQVFKDFSALFVFCNGLIRTGNPISI